MSENRETNEHDVELEKLGVERARMINDLDKHRRELEQSTGVVGQFLELVKMQKLILHFF